MQTSGKQNKDPTNGSACVKNSDIKMQVGGIRNVDAKFLLQKCAWFLLFYYKTTPSICTKCEGSPPAGMYSDPSEISPIDTLPLIQLHTITLNFPQQNKGTKSI